jgi:hypothetical protein
VGPLPYGWMQSRDLPVGAGGGAPPAP